MKTIVRTAVLGWGRAGFSSLAFAEDGAMYGRGSGSGLQSAGASAGSQFVDVDGDGICDEQPAEGGSARHAYAKGKATSKGEAKGEAKGLSKGQGKALRGVGSGDGVPTGSSTECDGSLTQSRQGKRGK